jgi:hypothetical protein
MIWAGHILTGQKRNEHKVCVRKSEGKRPLGKPRRRCDVIEARNSITWNFKSFKKWIADSVIICRGLLGREPREGAKLSAGGGSDVLATSSLVREKSWSLPVYTCQQHFPETHIKCERGLYFILCVNSLYDNPFSRNISSTRVHGKYPIEQVGLKITL